MSEDYSDIIAKANELSSLIKNHDITDRYHEIQEDMKRDHKSQELLARLVMLGEELTRKGRQGEPIQAEKSSEYILLQQELEKNELVKDFILRQKEYLNMIHLMQDRIKNPRRG
ncbi:MAG: hypothetical protein CVV44_17080 [Spirochaetae bacterium HGW-Spirochaetae-1]|jgi:cell fate (sporulation/competence/biofilm development) regulator YlbF (YheA/YmcA/DUF963 family)|nr:MAG: hypothetical protein CVV44_17080 [Spirochaetae bacterium HGW-Spirochaetae-1]